MRKLLSFIFILTLIHYADGQVDAAQIVGGVLGSIFPQSMGPQPDFDPRWGRPRHHHHHHRHRFDDYEDVGPGGWDGPPPKRGWGRGPMGPSGDWEGPGPQGGWNNRGPQQWGPGQGPGGNQFGQQPQQQREFLHSYILLNVLKLLFQHLHRNLTKEALLLRISPQI